MKSLHLHVLDSRMHLVKPEEFNEVSLASPVREIFTDFKTHNPLVIESDTFAWEALHLMEKAHVHLVLVVKNNELIGQISQEELNEQQLMVKQQQGYDRNQLKVDDLMVKRADLKALNEFWLHTLTIAEFIDLLKEECMQHCLVTDVKNKQIRGIISARDIARRLHIDVDIPHQQSFADICRAVNDY